MTKEQSLFLRILKISLKDAAYKETEASLTEQAESLSVPAGFDRQALLRLAAEQGLLPLTADCIYNTPSLNRAFTGDQSFDASEWTKYRDAAVSASVRQITQANEFLTILLHAQERGLDPIVLKGVVCRNLYPKPMLRPSVDEDLLIEANDTEAWHSLLLSEGLFRDGAADGEELSGEAASAERKAREEAPELSYHKSNSPTYLELHKTLFDPASEIFGSWNSLFREMEERAVRVQIEDVSVRTLCPTDHLLFLILHAMKHFLHSGIGIRSICDIGMFSRAYTGEIDWKDLCGRLHSVKGLYYTAALYRILEEYILPGEPFYEMFYREAGALMRSGGEPEWNQDGTNADTSPLLRDILASGVHGDSSMIRLHSSNITLQAASSEKGQDGALKNTLRSVFLPLKSMKNSYPYLKRAPYLLPAAWVQRLTRFLKEKRGAALESAAESVQLGGERAALLRKYHII